MFSNYPPSIKKSHAVMLNQKKTSTDIDRSLADFVSYNSSSKDSSVLSVFRRDSLNIDASRG